MNKTEDQEKLLAIQALARNITKDLSQKDRDEVAGLVVSSVLLITIKKAMDEQKLLKKDLAQKIGTSPSYISQLFNGDRLLNMVTFAKMLKALDLQIDVAGRSKSDAPATHRQSIEALPNLHKSFQKQAV